MPSKKRDPLVTGKVRLPWGPDDPCPCGSTMRAADCCRLENGLFYTRVRYPVPPPPLTGHINAHCYMSATRDCSEKISREHFLSASVLRLVDERYIKVTGAAWIPSGEIRELPIGRLHANILCKRHNEAFSPLDAGAARFFGAVREIFDDIANEKTLSRKAKWRLFSGEELELWLLKAAFGLYESGVLVTGPNSLRRDQSINPALLRSFSGNAISEPCGIYVLASDGEHWGNRNAIDIRSVLSTDGLHVTGISVAFMGLTLLIALDPRASYTALANEFTYRPSYLQFRNSKRFHSIVLTWPGAVSTRQRAVLYTRKKVGR